MPKLSSPRMNLVDRFHTRAVTALCVAGSILQLLDHVLAVPGESAAWRVLGSLGWGAWAGAAHLGLDAAGTGAAKAGRQQQEPLAPLGRVAGWLGAGLVVLLGEGLRHTAMGTTAASTDAAVAASIEIWPAAVSVAIFALAPALGEELFFRGAPLRWLTRRWGPTVAWVSSTSVFAAAHPDSAAMALLLGAAFTTLALATGRARESVVAHTAHNLLGLSALGPWAS